MSETDRSRYTEEELYGLAENGKLPGFISPAEFGPELFQGTAWQPVHNMAVIKLDEREPLSPTVGLSILTAIRNRDANPTHPDVVSTPTRRMVNEQAAALLTEKDASLQPAGRQAFQLSEVNPARPQLIAPFSPNLEPLQRAGVLPTLAGTLLQEKLGLGALEPEERLLWNRLGMVSLSKVLAGFSYVSDTEAGVPQYEPIIMFGSVLSSGLIPLPIVSDTNDYRNVSWTPAGEFPKNVQNRNVASLVLASEWDEVYVCVRGMCLATSAQSVADLEDIRRHMGYAQPGTLLRSLWRPDLGVEVVTI